MLISKTLVRISLLLSLIVSSGCYYANGVVYDPQKAHHGTDGFISTKESSFFGHLMMRWREDSPPPRDPLAIEKIQMPADINLIHSTAEQPRVTWIGHATSLVQYKDISYLTDPHLTQHPFYFEMFVDPRYTQPALTFEQMPDIDFVVISHNHFDHLDHRTVDLFANSVIWYVPLGLKNWFLDRGIAADRIVELDWWESHAFSDEVEITFAPNEHWSKRTPWDTNQSLWGSWAVNIAGFKSWFAGDTGYHESYFREIGERLGPFRLAMIPIGAYAPRYFMELAHVDPAQAIDIHRDIQSQQSVPVHWGTFQLTIEPVLEPPELLRSEMALRKIPIETFEPIKIGQTLILD
jgi:N-acyl-phosphatidylethanolamine-hydrolysing phospholipase D